VAKARVFLGCVAPVCAGVAHGPEVAHWQVNPGVPVGRASLEQGYSLACFYQAVGQGAPCGACPHHDVIKSHHKVSIIYTLDLIFSALTISILIKKYDFNDFIFLSDWNNFSNRRLLQIWYLYGPFESLIYF
jgi:hypothetical protein